MHYSMLIKGSSSNGSFDSINPSMFKDPYITSMTVLFKSNQVKFNNMDTINVVTNFTFIRFNLVSTYLPLVEFANSLYRIFSTVVMNLALFSFNRFTYSNMNGACLKGVYVKPYERNQPK